jgi:hypothetical protein
MKGHDFGGHIADETTGCRALATLIWSLCCGSGAGDVGAYRGARGSAMKTSIILSALVAAAPMAFAQQAANTNPLPGWAWTYLGPSFGADLTLPLGRPGCLSISSFGGVGNGAGDTGPALTAALAAQPQRSCVWFEPGRYKFAAPFTYTYSGGTYDSLTIMGSGADVTELIGPNNASGFTFNLKGGFNSIHLRDFSFVTPSACSVCTGIAINQLTTALLASGDTAQSDLTRVSMYGSDRGPTTGSNYWGNNIVVNGVSNINFVGVYIQGIYSSPGASQVGIRLKGPSPYSTYQNAPVIFNMTGLNASQTMVGVEMGCYVQGLTINQSNIIGNKWGVWASPCADGASSPQGMLTVNNSSFNGLVGIYADSLLGGAQITNNFIVAGQGGASFGTDFYGILFGALPSYEFVMGNTLVGGPTHLPGTTTFGIGLYTSPENVNQGQINTNHFISLDVGIAIAPNVSGWSIGTNRYTKLGTSIINNSGFGNNIATQVTGGRPTVATGSGDCGTGPIFEALSTDASGMIEVGTSPGTKCTVTFSKPFLGALPRCFAHNNTSLTRQVQAVFVSATSMQLASTGALNGGDFLQYRCDGYQ